MSDDVARRIVAMVLLGVGWGTLCAALSVPWGWWLIGLVALDLIVFHLLRPREAKKPKHSRKRVGPPLEWID